MAHHGESKRHYIREWAKWRGLSQAKIVRAFGEVVDADRAPNKSTVSRWFAGTLPHQEHLDRLAEIIGVNETAALFRDPQMEWAVEVLRGRNPEERERIINTLKAAFPRRAT